MDLKIGLVLTRNLEIAMHYSFNRLTLVTFCQYTDLLETKESVADLKIIDDYLYRRDPVKVAKQHMELIRAVYNVKSFECFIEWLHGLLVRLRVQNRIQLMDLYFFYHPRK